MCMKKNLIEWFPFHVYVVVLKYNVTLFPCSSPCHTWDAFQLAHASFRLYCIRNNSVVPRNSEKAGGKLGPSLLGEAPIIEVALPEVDDGDEEDGSESNLSAVKIHDDDVSVRFLICGEACSLVSN